MAGKHDSAAEPGWRPLAKLSGFMKHSSTKPKKVPGTTAVDEKSSVFKFARQKKAPSPETAPHFEPLEVDVDILEAFRLSEGWLETNDKRNPADQKRDRDGPNRNQQSGEQQRQQPPDRSNSSTPIGDLFAAKKAALITASDSVELGRSGSYNHGRSSSRPFSMVETETSTYGRASPDSGRDGSVAGSILDRGRPVEPRRYVTDPLVKTKSLKQELAEAAEAAEAAAAQQNALSSSQLQPPKSSVDTSKRHSMYAGVTPPLNSSVPTRTTTKPVQAPSTTNVSAVPPVDRIKTWQKSVTSAPMGPPPVPTSNSASALNPAPAAAAGSTRKVSPRGLTGNRLAWIRELEEKKANSANQNVAPGPKKLGSVSDRLAMFESKQSRNAAAAAAAALSSSASHLPPGSSITRSNSTVSTSRMSSAGLESASSAYGGTRNGGGDNESIAATPRTSIDTMRSTHRASSVLSYYDESFRGKMETIVGDYDKDKAAAAAADAAQKKQRVTTQFVPVKGETSSQPEAGTSNNDEDTLESKKDDEKEKEEQVLQSHQQPEAGASTSEVEKVEEEPTETQPEPEPEASLSSTEPAKDAEKDTKEVIQVDAGPTIEESEEKKGEVPTDVNTTEKNITNNEA